MKRPLLVLCLVLVGMPLLWYGALTVEALAAARALAQLIHLPDDFFTTGEPASLQRVSNGHLEANFTFSPKYTGRYQILVAPVAKKYGAVVEASSMLRCATPGKQFQVRADDGRIEFDRALKLGFVGRLLTFDTASHASVGLSYTCDLSIETAHSQLLRQVYVRKLTDN